jgi:hypothetical protein
VIVTVTRAGPSDSESDVLVRLTPESESDSESESLARLNGTFQVASPRDDRHGDD